MNALAHVAMSYEARLHELSELEDALRIVGVFEQAELAHFHAVLILRAWQAELEDIKPERRAERDHCLQCAAYEAAPSTMKPAPAVERG